MVTATPLPLKARPAATATKPLPPPPGASKQSLPPPPSATGSAPPSRPPSSTSQTTRIPAKSHQTGTIDHHWNDLPSNLLAPSYSRGASRSTSATESRSTSPRPSSSSADCETSTEATSSTSPSPSADEFPAVMKQLFTSSPSSLQDRERAMIYARVQKAESGMLEAMKEELVDVVGKVLRGEETVTWGRERVVEFMMREKGVAGWATGLRRGLESIMRE